MQASNRHQSSRIGSSLLALSAAAAAVGCQLDFALLEDGEQGQTEEVGPGRGARVRASSAPPPVRADRETTDSAAQEQPDVGTVPEHSGVGTVPTRPEPASHGDDGLIPFEYRDLIVIDPALVNGELASNANPDAPWSFRRQMSWLAGDDADSLEFTRAWLESWAIDYAVGPELAPVVPRQRVLEELVEPWLDRRPMAESSYGPPPAGAGWAGAPFRLLAIVNRVDLADGACDGRAGELRYVYAALDPATAQPLDATLIIEIPYPESRPAADWARAFGELFFLEADAYTAALARLTTEVAEAADPLRARVRTNDVAFAPDGFGWELREFRPELDAGRVELAPAPLELTPRADADPARLADYVFENDGALRGTAATGSPLPAALQAGAAEVGSADFSWSVPGADETLREAFSRQTCNGCHGGDSQTLPFQHVAPAFTADGPARLSRFLYDPEAEEDELGRRAFRLEELAATECGVPTEQPPYAAEVGTPR
jgi:hypothetical protein